MSKDIEERLIALIAERLGWSRHIIDPTSRLVEDLKLTVDNPTTYDIIFDVVEEFNMIDIPDEDFENIKTVEDAAEYIEEKLKE